MTIQHPLPRGTIVNVVAGSYSTTVRITDSHPNRFKPSITMYEGERVTDGQLVHFADCDVASVAPAAGAPKSPSATCNFSNVLTAAASPSGSFVVNPVLDRRTSPPTPADEWRDWAARNPDYDASEVRRLYGEDPRYDWER